MKKFYWSRTWLPTVQGVKNDIVFL